MKFRRIRTNTSERPLTQAFIENEWVEMNVLPEVLEASVDVKYPGIVGTTALPFQPRSFRDFMLYEKHVISSSRGYARRFLPGAARLAGLYETVFRKPFPAFRPKPIWYQQPIYYFGNHLTFVPSGTSICAPSYSTAFDYELELGFVLSRPLRNATPNEAIAAIGAFVVLNDFSARDVQRQEMLSGFGPQKAKHFMSSMSDTAVTADELINDVNGLSASVVINGREICKTSTAGMYHSIGAALAHASKDEQLHPGELFGTGTLPGGCGLENGVMLKSGDFLQLRIDRVGEIQHRII